MAEATTRARIQRFGSYLSGMIMPNIGAFIAWGLITALFIPDGWIPNEKLATLVGPMITYLLPLLIGFTGGRLVYDFRGGVLGAIATMGVIVGAEIPMFLGAMIMGPLAGFAMKLIDGGFQHRIRPGFEMLYNNFSAGILGAFLAGISVYFVGPLVNGLTNALASGVEVIVDMGLLPLASIIIEPAKILFLNNAINHGILSPLGVEQAADAGKSVLFLLESNPGPGLGILLAFSVFGKGISKSSAPGAAIIQFLGGIHEIYFPYVLMKPMLLLAVIAGGISGVFTFTLFNAGLVATPSPGSIFALMALTPPGNYPGVILGVLIAAAVSFAIASVVLKTSKVEEEDLSAAANRMQEMKGKKSDATGYLTPQPAAGVIGDAGARNLASDNTQAVGSAPVKSSREIKKVVFACDAGMGSSAMGASLLRNKFKKAQIDIPVSNTAINQLPADADVVVTHKDLTDRAKAKLPQAEHISVENFMNSPEYDKLAQRLKEQGE
ncbi:PTS mannitol transporter subunit IICB [Planomicrobium sp. CPCC 101110]|uniref:PTS mannitol transporter subunit IICB n=1 Tax=Planomicrobium sp. CPCC 101110 TaxID=2599619 RepID=UPI0011B6AB69|nr:PTS mannitol transporter subunit IICB [Planomicrobium sp. CPCC 101110]TWT25871.1 PTS mannitol transporter subunit IICB [Planomicrobium sp. CPCC 101110]